MLSCAGAPSYAPAQDEVQPRDQLSPDPALARGVGDSGDASVSGNPVAEKRRLSAAPGEGADVALSRRAARRR